MSIYVVMDHSPIRQTFEFGKSISTAGKSILNFIQLSSLVANIVKCGECSPVNFANFVYFCITHGRVLPLCGNVVTLFPTLYKSIQNPQTLHNYTFDILQYCTTKLHNFTNFRKLFPTVL